MSLDHPPQPTLPTGGLARLRRWLVGAPRHLQDLHCGHHLSLAAVLAWVGLGADGLSSSAYGPEEAFKAIGSHTHLAVLLALATAGTVFLLTSAYSRMIEAFPNGGGYAVASRCLGARSGVVSGAALLVDYVLTIAISIAAAADAVFSLAPPAWQAAKLPVSLGLTALLLVVNLRGVRESILLLAPIFAVFVVTHTILIASGLVLQAPEVGATVTHLRDGIHHDLGSSGIGLLALGAIFLNAYALGGGTYTGIEAVSNALPLMREPRVRTAKRTMAMLAWSLALCAGGLIVCYLLWHIEPQAGKTMNAVLVEAVARHLPFGGLFTTLTLVSAGALLVVAAQAGFIGGPRVMANLAADGWLPRRFTRLSDRLVTEQGVLTIGGAALLALAFTHGAVDLLVVMYSINVFLTFTLTMAGMVRFWWEDRTATPWLRRRRLALFGLNAALCAGILVVTVVAKFSAGGWVTVAATGLVVALCLLVRDHYRRLNARLIANFQPILPAPLTITPAPAEVLTGPRCPPTLVVLTGSWNGTGWHTLLNALRTFPGHFRQVVVAGVVEVDAVGSADTVAAEAELARRLAPWVPQVQALGLPCSIRTGCGTEADAAVETLCRSLAKDHPRLLVVAGKVLIEHEGWLHRLLHNDTAMAVHRRLQWAGIPVHIVAARLQRN